ncbi:MAG: SDR family NAD(P)-dependent oxidoreductase [Acidobacteriota bacterium]
MGSETSKVAIVTGGSRGIGRACVEALLIEGYGVWFCSRNPNGVREAERRWRERWDGRVHGRAVDVGDQGEVDAFVEEVHGAEGRIDCLVNNAGLGFFAPVDEITGDDWRRVRAANLDGPFYFTRAVAPIMRRQGEGFIVNVASLAGRNAFAGGSVYNATKFGLLGLSEAAMLDLRQDGVRVAAVLPGSVATDFHAGGAGVGSTPTANMLRAEDVARSILDLLSYPGHALPSRVELRPARPKS